MILSAAGVSKVSCHKNEVVRHGNDLFWHVRDFPGIENSHRCLYLVDDGLKRLVDVVGSVHSCRVEFQVRWGNIVISILQVTDSLQARVVPVSNVLIFKGMDINILEDPQKLLF